ncbi:hypothetical protein [Leucobacter sp. W1478]|uniref:hypothetical protein n=1 Tax=Leucobacter sp. W1478 TaxID=3439065 RepID=UPI003F359F38
MTDGRIPGKWVTEPRFAEMDSDTWAIFTRALAWSNEAGTDGAVKRRYLGMFHNSGELLPRCYDNLEALGLWRKTPDGYQLEKWDTPAHRGGLGQATAESVRNGKARNAAKQRRFRERLAGGEDLESEAITPSNPVTSPGYVGQDTTGQDTTGQANYGSDEENGKTATDTAVGFAEVGGLSVDVRTGEVFEVAPCCGLPHDPLVSCSAAGGDFG